MVVCVACAAGVAPPSPPGFCTNLGFGTCAYNLTGAATVGLYGTVCNAVNRFWGERRLCWTAPASGTVQASLCTESYDSVIAVYSGCSTDVNSSPGTELACGDDQCGSAAKAVFTAVQGTQYMITAKQHTHSRRPACSSNSHTDQPSVALTTHYIAVLCRAAAWWLSSGRLDSCCRCTVAATSHFQASQQHNGLDPVYG